VRIYLGGASAEVERVLSARDLLVKVGHTITEAWWERIAEARSRGWKSDAEVPPDFKAKCCDRNLAGIEVADRTIIIAKRDGGFSSGAAGEIGYAVARSLVYLDTTEDQMIRGDQPILQQHSWCRMPPILVGNTNGYILSPRCVVVQTVENALALLR